MRLSVRKKSIKEELFDYFSFFRSCTLAYSSITFANPYQITHSWAVAEWKPASRGIDRTSSCLLATRAREVNLGGMKPCFRIEIINSMCHKSIIKCSKQFAPTVILNNYI